MRGHSLKPGKRRTATGTTRRPVGALDDLAVFMNVAQNTSFAEASRRLAIPTSSVSRAVARLEDELGIQLLRRTSRKVALTDEGRQLFLHAAAHLEGLEEALASAADRHPEPSGVVRVTAPAYTGATRVARALGAFAVAHPKISIELDATNTIRDLLQDGFDFGIRVGPYLNPDFIGRRLWQSDFGLFASHEFVKTKLRGKKLISRETIEREPCVVLRTSTTWKFRVASGDSVAVSPCTRFAVNDPRGAADVARAGLGIVLVPVDAVADDPRGLVPLRTDFGELEPVELYVVYPTRRLLPQRVRMAIDWLASDATTATPTPPPDAARAVTARAPTTPGARPAAARAASEEAAPLPRSPRR